MRFRHLVFRAQVSACHTIGETFAAIIHGRAFEIDVRAPEQAGFLAYVHEVYPDWDEWYGDDTPPQSRIQPTEMSAYAFAPSGPGGPRPPLNRVYPGKPALFAELVRAFSPIEALVANMDRLADQPPEKALPELAVSVWRTVSSHLGIVRPLLFEVASLGPDVREGVLGEFFPKVFVALGGYLLGQMAAGRLRPMHPILAIQSFAGPLILHLLLRPMVTEGLGLELDSEAAVREFATNWVRGMQPDPPHAGM